MLAIHAYIALCYYKLDYYDISQEVLNVYLQKIPNQDSFYLRNLKACNIYRLYNGQNAEVEIQSLLVSTHKLPYLHPYKITVIYFDMPILGLSLQCIRQGFIGS